MKKVNKKILKEAANKLLFDMNDQEYETLLKDFDDVLKKMEIMNSIPGLDEEIPMDFPFEIKYSLEDMTEESSLKKEDFLKNCNEVEDGMVRLPKVVR